MTDEEESANLSFHITPGECARQFAEAYLKAARPWIVTDDDEKALFVSHHRGRRLAVRTLGQIVSRAAK